MTELKFQTALHTASFSLQPYFFSFLCFSPSYSYLLVNYRATWSENQLTPSRHQVVSRNPLLVLFPTQNHAVRKTSSFRFGPPCAFAYYFGYGVIPCSNVDIEIPSSFFYLYSALVHSLDYRSVTFYAYKEPVNIYIYRFNDIRLEKLHCARHLPQSSLHR